MNRRGSITLDTAIILPVIILALVFLFGGIGRVFINSVELSSKLEKNAEEWKTTKPGRQWSGVNNEIEK